MFLIVKFVTLNATLRIPASISPALRRKSREKPNPPTWGALIRWSAPLIALLASPFQCAVAMLISMSERLSVIPPLLVRMNTSRTRSYILTGLLVEGDDGFDVNGLAEPVEDRQRLVQLRRRPVVEALGQVLEEGDRVVFLEDVADRIPASRVVLYRHFLFAQETEVVSHSLLVSLGVLEQV